MFTGFKTYLLCFVQVGHLVVKVTRVAFQEKDLLAVIIKLAITHLTITQARQREELTGVLYQLRVVL